MRSVLLIFIGLIALLVTSQVRAAICWASYDCSYCGSQCVSCASQRTLHPSYINITVNQMPTQFAFSSGDINPGNDVGYGSGICAGAVNCAGSSVSYTNHTLPGVSNQVCEMNPINKLPTTLSCYYRDGYPTYYCGQWIPATCAYPYSC